jgi:uncharacterized repeat protein (TIGR01451 family)
MRLGRHRTIRVRRLLRRRAAAVVVPAVVVLLGAVAPLPLASADTTGEPAAITSTWQVASFVAPTPADGWDSGSDVPAQVMDSALTADAVVLPGIQLTYALRLSPPDSASETPAESPIVTDDLSSLDGFATLDTGALPADVTWHAASHLLTWTPSTAPSVGDSASVAFSVTVGDTGSGSATLATLATVNGSSCTPGGPCATSVTVQPAPVAGTGPEDSTGTGTAAGAGTGTAAGPMGAPALLGATACSTPGGFEIDGNMAADCGGIDWATGGLGVSATSSFRALKTTKDSNPLSGWEEGGSPSQDSLMDRAYGYATTGSDGHYYAFAAWHRSSGTGASGFIVEFTNGNTTSTSSHGVSIPDRSHGGTVLYLTSPGGSALSLAYVCTYASASNYPSFSGQKIPSGCAPGSSYASGFTYGVNSAPIMDALNGDASYAVNTFVEIGVDLTTLAGITPGCPPAVSTAALSVRSYTGDLSAGFNLQQTGGQEKINPPSTCAELTLVKHVDQNGTTGSATAAAWQLSATGATQTFGPAAGSETGTVYANVKPGSYQLAETGHINGYTNGTEWQCYMTGYPDSAVPSPENIVTLVTQQHVTCVITNTAHQPTLVTTATATAFAGEAIGDTATLTGEISLGTPTGTVTFAAYGPFTAAEAPLCTGLSAFTSDPVPVAADGTAATPGFTPADSGHYFWVATYSGDANYLSVAGTCGEPGETSIVATPATVTVTKTLPTINGAAADPGAVAAAGDILGYSIALTNTGGSPGEVTLTETVPENTTYTGDTTEGWTCTAGSTCTQTVTVPPQTTSTATPPVTTPGTASVTFTVTVAATLPLGTLSIDNTVTPQGATCTEPDATPDGCTTTNPTPPVLTVHKTLLTVNGTAVTAPGTPVMAGDALGYQIVVTNTGGSDGATTLTEAVPVNTSYSGSADEHWTCADVVAGSGCTQVITVSAATSTGPSSQPVSFTVTVDAPVASTASPITNTVDPGDGATCTEPTDCTTTNPLHGMFQIRKVGADGATALSGAEFALYPDAAGAPDTSSAGVGLTAIDGSLWATPYLAPGTYWLVETKAPAGYDLLAASVKVVLLPSAAVTLPDASGAPVTLVNATATELATVTVSDRSVLVLPLLGGSGSSAMTGGGVLLLLLSGGALILTLRRRPTERRRL